MAEAAGDAPPAPVPDAARRRRRRLLPLAVGGVVVVTAAVALVWALTGARSESQPERAARAFVTGLHRGDCAAVLERLSSASYQHFEDVADLLSSPAGSAGFDFRKEACTVVRAGKRDATVTAVDTVVDGGDGAVVRVTSSFRRGTVTVRSGVDLYVVRESEGWKVDLTLDVAESTLLLPDMEFRQPEEPGPAETAG